MVPFSVLLEPFDEQIQFSLLARRLSRIRYSTNLRLNASARPSPDGTTLYTFNMGAAVALLDVCHSLICEEAFCPEIPFEGANVIDADVPNPQERFSDYSYLEADGGVRFVPCTRILIDPNDLELKTTPRGRLGNHLFEQCCKFLSLHEQAHFVLGHLGYSRARCPSKMSLDEVSADRTTGIPPADLRALELSADKFACVFRLNQIFTGNVRKTPNGLWLPEAEATDKWLLYSFLGATIIISLLDRGDRNILQKTGERSHPTAAARLLGLFQDLHRVLLLHIPQVDEREKIMGPILSACEVIFQLLECAPLSNAALEEYFDPTVRVYKTAAAAELAATIKRGNQFSPDLRPYVVESHKSLNWTLPSNFSSPG